MIRGHYEVLKGEQGMWLVLESAMLSARMVEKTKPPNNASSVFSFGAVTAPTARPRQLSFPLYWAMKRVSPPDLGRFQGTWRKVETLRAARSTEP